MANHSNANDATERYKDQGCLFCVWRSDRHIDRSDTK